MRSVPLYIRRCDTWERLYWLYGFQRTLAIIYGNDPATEADLAAWRRLGRARAA